MRKRTMAAIGTLCSVAACGAGAPATADSPETLHFGVSTGLSKFADVLTDRGTGCQYLVITTNEGVSVTPRLIPNGMGIGVPSCNGAKN